MKKKYFLCSDIHSDFKALQEALKEHQFDIDNPQHILVVAGDIFDRGSESVALYEFLKDLCDKNRAIVLQGNHHQMFIDFLENKNLHLCSFNYVRNGMKHTVADFLHRTEPWDTYIILKYSDQEQHDMTNEDWNREWAGFVERSAKEINDEYPELLPWLKSLPHYLELKNTIVTHGMIDCHSEDWHNPDIKWEDCHWAKPHEAAFMRNSTGKHVYLGHIDSETIREVWNEPKGNYELYTRQSGDVTYLDSCTIYTHKVNMVVVEDEEIE